MRAEREDTLVLLPVVGEDEVFERDLNADPLLVAQSRPDVVRLRDGGLVWLQDDLCPLRVDVEGPQNQNETGKGLQEQNQAV